MNTIKSHCRSTMQTQYNIPDEIADMFDAMRSTQVPVAPSNTAFEAPQAWQAVADIPAKVIAKRSTVIEL